MAPTETASDDLYDEYPPSRRTDPASLAAVAHLYGLDAPDISSARVVEIGCGTGINLMTFAERHPGAHCVGIDASAARVAWARRIAAAVGLRNVEFVHADIAGWRHRGEAIDVLIANGVYTSVPPAERNALLAICERDLAATGFAMFAYDTLPGGIGMVALRDAIAYLRARRDPPSAAADRDIVDMLGRAASEGSPADQNILPLEAARLLSRGEVGRGNMTDARDPVYFHAFAERAAAFGLQYVWDAEIDTGSLATLPAEIAQAIRDMGNDAIGIEQTLDFIRNRRRRHSILCRASTMIDRTPVAGRLESGYFASDIRPTGPRVPGRPMAFQSRRGRTRMIETPVMGAALTHLGEIWPRASDYSTLTAVVHQTAGDDTAAIDRFRHEFLDLVLAGWVRHWLAPPPVAGGVSARPRALGIARALSAETDRVPNAHNAVVSLDAEERRLLAGVDGYRDLKALAALGYAAADALPPLLSRLAAKAILTA